MAVLKAWTEPRSPVPRPPAHCTISTRTDEADDL